MFFLDSEISVELDGLLLVVWLLDLPHLHIVNVEFFQIFIKKDKIEGTIVSLTSCATLNLNFFRFLTREESRDNMQSSRFINLLIAADEIGTSSEWFCRESNLPWISSLLHDQFSLLLWAPL